MARTSSGVYQLSDGTWGFRYAFWVDGKQKDIKRTKDENGNQFKTERAATFTNTFLLITLENTVQKEAQRIRRSPIRYRRGFP